MAPAPALRGGIARKKPNTRNAITCNCMSDPSGAGREEPSEGGARLPDDGCACDCDADVGTVLCAPAGKGPRAFAVAVTTKGGKAKFISSGLDLEGMKEILKGRDNIVMTRVRDEDLAILDLLVEAGLFDSRSECAAYLLHEGIAARKDLADKVQDTARRIRELREKVKKEVGSAG